MHAISTEANMEHECFCCARILFSSLIFKCLILHKHAVILNEKAFSISLLSSKPRVTVTSCFVYKVIRDLESIDHLYINPTADRINTQLINRLALAQVECTS